MGCLILCNKTKSKKPYYIEEFHLHIYTIEELCFYLCNNIFVLNTNILNDNLCNWIEDDLDMPNLAHDLRKYVKSKSLTMFVVTALKNTGFCDSSELEDIQNTLSSFKDQTIEEQTKKKADNLLGTGKYELALREYENIVRNSTNNQLGAKFFSKVNHNIGVAYARQFLFVEASQYFKKAYDLYKNDDSIKQYLFSCYMGYSHKEFNEKISEDPSYKSYYEQIIKEYNNKEKQYKFYQEQQKRDNKSIDDRIEDCKNEYRRSLY